jgi:TldD protein
MLNGWVGERWGNVQELLASKIKKFKNKADYLEIRVEESEGTTIGFRGEGIENVSQPSVKGGCVRALYKGGWGFVSFNDLSDLGGKVEAAISQAKAAKREKSQLAEVTPVEDSVRASFKKDPRGVSLSSKVRLLSGYNDLLFNTSPKIQSTAVGYSDGFKRKHFVNSEGTTLYQEQAGLTSFASAIAGKDDIIQACHQIFDGGDDFGAFENLSYRIESLARQAVELLKAPPAKAGTYTVVLGPAMSGLLAHEAFGHISEADNVYENKDLKKVMKLGRRFGSKVLNIIDDSTLPQYGHYVYDDEGVAAQKTHLIKEGVLVGRLHSLETAAKMGEKPTGNARALSYNNFPIVRMSNTYVEPGQSKLEDLIKDVKLGIMTHGWLGGSTTGEMFTFTAGWGQMIRNGRLAETVRDVKLTGNIFETLKSIDGVSADLKWEAGYCGKRDQRRLPTATGGPYVRCRDVVVGGK